MFTIEGYHEKSDPPTTQPDTPDPASVVCLTHDTCHKQQQHGTKVIFQARNFVNYENRQNFHSISARHSVTSHSACP